MVLLAQANVVEQFAVAFEALGAAWVLWLLVGLSIVSVAVMIERIIYFVTHTIGDNETLRDQLAKGELEAAIKTVEGKRGMEAEVVRRGIAAAANGPESVDEIVMATVVTERLRYERFLNYLGTLGNNAPFIGLFGTVLGIISAFAALAQSAKQGTVTSGSSNIMAGISEALVATAVGLLVALPAVAIYNVFTKWLKTITARSEALGHALQSHLKALPPEAPADKGPVSLPRIAGS